MNGKNPYTIEMMGDYSQGLSGLAGSLGMMAQKKQDEQRVQELRNLLMQSQPVPGVGDGVPMNVPQDAGEADPMPDLINEEMDFLLNRKPEGMIG